MRRIAITTLVVLGVVAMAAAQAGTTTGSSSGFQLSTPQRKVPRAAKTAEEGTAYQAVVSNPDLAAAEAAAKDFEAKYPQSELSNVVYQRLMYRYQQANNAEKTVEMGRKALQSDGDNPMVLVNVATVLAERTRETDLDRDQRLAEAMKDAQHTLDGMGNWLATAPGITDAQANGIKPVLASMAQAAMGLVETTRKNPAEAEKHYQASVELNPAQPDPLNWLRLALARDQQKKYTDALTAANRAVELSTAAGGPVSDWAKQEQSRLQKLTGQTPPPAPAPAPQQPAPPPKS